jgi:AraC-like DNA-binding protein
MNLKYNELPKNNMIKKTLLLQLFLCLILCQLLQAQKCPDSLKKKSYDYLIQRLDANDQNSVLADVYLKSILAKGKKEPNSDMISFAYENIALLSKGNLKTTYADSLLAFTTKIKDNDLIANAYIVYGSIHYAQKKYLKALDSFIAANKFADNTKDEYLKNTIKYHIATLKIYLGFYEESEKLLIESARYFKVVDTAGYVNSLHALSLCYNKTGKYALCTSINNEGLKVSQHTNTVDRNYFIHSEGINQYSLKNYKIAIQKLTASIPVLAKSGDFANETVGYFYIGKSYLGLKDTLKALEYLRKVDRAFLEKNYIRPDLRENYEILINYYKKKQDTKMQLHYVEKLLKADSVLTNNFRYISGKVHKEYDSHKLELAREKLTKELEAQENTNYILYLTVAILFFLSLFFIYRYYINQRNYRQKYEELMLNSTNTIDEPHPVTEIKDEPKQLDINPEVVASILKQLSKFEANKKFLQKDLTLVNLAGTFNTNTNYLSKVINHSRHKNYITYLNDLRIDYIVGLLKTDQRFRNYTIKALAEEAGFSTAQHFSKAFYAHTGIYPSYFVTELNREYQ